MSTTASTDEIELVFVCRYFNDYFLSKGYQWDDPRLGTTWFDEDQTDGGLEYFRHKGGICALNNLVQDLESKLPNINLTIDARELQRPYSVWKFLILEKLLKPPFHWGHIAAAIFRSADLALQLEVTSPGGKGGAFYVAEWTADLLGVMLKPWFLRNGGTEVGGWPTALMSFYKKVRNLRQYQSTLVSAANQAIRRNEEPNPNQQETGDDDDDNGCSCCTVL